MPKSRIALVALVAANLLPIFAVLIWDWKVFELMGLYWAETAVIGGFNILKMLRIAGPRAIPLCVFFTVHFGGFMAGHGFFVLHMFGDESSSLWQTVSDVRWQLIALVVSHGYSYFAYFVWGDEYKARKLAKQMFVPYPRIIVMHVTIIFGTMLVMAMGSNIGPLLLLIALKIGSDIFSHRLEHKVKS